MTIATALKHAKIEANEIGIDDFTGLTKSGKKFRMYRAGGAYGLQFTLEIEGQNRVTHCLYRTAVRKIKTTWKHADLTAIRGEREIQKMKYTVEITDEDKINIIRALRVAARVSNDAAQLNKHIPNMERILLQRASDYKGLADMFSSIICNDEE